MVIVDPEVLYQQALARIPARWHKHVNIRGIEEGLIITIEIWCDGNQCRYYVFRNLFASSMLRVLKYIEADFNSNRPRGSIVFSRYSYLVGYNKEKQ
jgi:hypothetical protein